MVGRKHDATAHQCPVIYSAADGHAADDDVCGTQERPKRRTAPSIQLADPPSAAVRADSGRLGRSGGPRPDRLTRRADCRAGRPGRGTCWICWSKTTRSRRRRCGPTCWCGWPVATRPPAGNANSERSSRTRWTPTNWEAAPPNCWTIPIPSFADWRNGPSRSGWPPNTNVRKNA